MKQNESYDILLPYNLEVVGCLRKIEEHIRGEYETRRNSMELKSLEPKRDIEIFIDTKDCYQTLIKLLAEFNNEVVIKDYANIEKIVLILLRIFRYDGCDLWDSIRERLTKGKTISQPLYEFNYPKDGTETEIILVIKDHAAIPRDFVAAYFGYDTGIDGLNLLMRGSFLLPPDRSAYISVSGEAGIGKTSLVVKLITAFFHNEKFKNVYSESIYEKRSNNNDRRSLKKEDAEPLSLHYILMEQEAKNIIRLVKECNLIDENNKNVKKRMEGKSFYTEEKKIKEVIDFQDSESFSPMELIGKIE
jgi:hypothetical protein